MGGGERGREGGGVDLNLGTPEPVLSDKPPPPPCGGLLLSVGEARRSEKEVVMKGCVEKVKLVKEFVFGLSICLLMVAILFVQRYNFCFCFSAIC